jgi:hypothetical protein
MNTVEVDGCEEDEDDAKDSDSHVFGSNGMYQKCTVGAWVWISLTLNSLRAWISGLKLH